MFKTKTKDKLIRASAILIALLLLLGACSKQGGEAEPPKEPETNGSNIEVKEPDTPGTNESLFDWAKGNEKSSFIGYTVRMNNLQYHDFYSYEEVEEYPGNWCDRSDVMIEGLKDKNLEEAINTMLIEKVSEFADLDRIPDVHGIEELQKQGLDPRKFNSKSVNVFIQGKIGNILSAAIYCRGVYELDNEERAFLSECETFNIDLNSGKEICMLDLFADDVDGMKYLNDAVNEAILKIGSDDDPFVGAFFDENHAITLSGSFTGLKEDQKYYLDGESGNLVLLFDKDTPEFYSHEGCSKLNVNITEVAAFDRFVLPGNNIYENDAVVYNLIQRPLKADMTQSRLFESIEIPEISGSIWINAAVYGDLNEDQRQFTAASDEDVLELKNILTQQTREFEKQYGAGSTQCHGSISSYGFQYGDYINLNRDEYLSLSRKDDWMPLFNSSISDERCYKAGESAALKIEDIFNDPANWKEKVAPAIAKSALNSFGPSSSAPLDPKLMLEMSTKLLNYCTGFCIVNDSLRLSYSPPPNFLSQYNIPPEIESYEDYYFARYIPYADIGCEHLNIF
ncbi:MAG: hypothetical protein GX975_02755 [Clostridiales bacterium]|nr:hypothetical protein [Clostridiales bacterium]